MFRVAGPPANVIAAVESITLELVSEIHLVPLGNTNVLMLLSEQMIALSGSSFPLIGTTVAEFDVTVTVLVPRLHLPPHLGCTMPHLFFIN